MKKHRVSRKTIQRYVETQMLYTQDLLNCGLSSADRVHELRLVLKRLRAVATLLKSQDGFNNLNDDLKKLSKTLAVRRDHDIIEEWLVENRKIIPEQLLTKFRSQPLNLRLPAVVSVQNKLLALEPKLRKLLRKDEHWTVNRREAFRDGLRKIKIAYRHARRSKSPEDFHKLRKRIKTFKYQMESLQFPDGKKMELNRLTSLLGKGHDLLLVGATIEDLHRPELMQIYKKLLNQRNKLNNQALAKTKTFLKELS